MIRTALSRARAAASRRAVGTSEPHADTSLLASVGRATYGVKHLTLHSWGEGSKLHVGSFCSLARDIQVYLGGGHRTDWITTFPFGHIRLGRFPNGLVNGAEGHPASKGDVRIGNDVWIGDGAVLMSGITIADGCVIGARSVCARDTEPYGVYAGNPARKIRSRFEPHVIAQLLSLEWWNWPDDLIDEGVPLLQSEPTEGVLGQLHDLAQRAKGRRISR